MSTVGARVRSRSRFEADEEVDGGSVRSVSVAAARSVTSKKSTPTPTKKRLASEISNDDLDSDEVGGSVRGAEVWGCYLCESVIEAREDKRKWKGKFFHKACFAATRCCRRQLTGQELRNFDENMLDEPENFRGKCLPLVVSATQTRDPAIRKKAKQSHIAEKRKIKDEVAQKLLLNRNRFYRFHKDLDGWGRGKCDEVFDEKLAEQLGL